MLSCVTFCLIKLYNHLRTYFLIKIIPAINIPNELNISTIHSIVYVAKPVGGNITTFSADELSFSNVAESVGT